MKVLILAGGIGIRLTEDAELKPKPMIEIGGKPILWHIMKMYSNYGFNDFVVLTGYKSHIIKDYFINYHYRFSDLTIDMKNNTVEIHKTQHEPWTIKFINTGEHTMTGGRIKKAKDYINNERFLLTYGDTLTDLNINKVIEFHKNEGKLLTMTTVQPNGRFSAINVDKNNSVVDYNGKPKGDSTWINAGFFVCEPGVLNFIDNDDDCVFENKPLENLSKNQELVAYKHEGFWQCLNTLDDKVKLDQMWQTHQAPWIKNI